MDNDVAVPEDREPDRRDEEVAKDDTYVPGRIFLKPMEHVDFLAGETFKITLHTGTTASSMFTSRGHYTKAEGDIKWGISEPITVQATPEEDYDVEDADQPGVAEPTMTNLF